MSVNQNFITGEAQAAKILLDEIGRDDETLASDMIEGETSLTSALTRCLDLMDDCDVIMEGCAAVLAKIKARADAAKKRKEGLRGVVEQALVIAEVKTLQMPTATLTIRTVAPKPFISDEAALPSDFWKQPDPVIDRDKLKNADANTPGVDMTNGGVSLQIRRV